MNVKQICGIILLGISGFMAALFTVFYKSNPFDRNPHGGTVDGTEDATKRVQADLGKARGSVQSISSGIDELEKSNDSIAESIDRLTDLNKRSSNLVADIERQNGIAGK
jgi:peptidoglycan hydrolase CwlO-like protein